MTAAQMSKHNANYVGGDIIVGGATLFAAMVGPTLRWNPWSTPIPQAYLCSAATPPERPCTDVRLLRRAHGAQARIRAAAADAGP
ncbi:hypothetical protein MSAR_00040 [Mycolicibacterium sarraceniae]|uniref:Uncharacterized protein n=1 Tax=Mycolicibacterium sarraceniae TaxID=1534348 RepID=A0A7I7SJC0_9MYCO|nr:hypothetical protein MSAR_00040 [Mycolicibacterium sarraceniae]